MKMTRRDTCTVRSINPTRCNAMSWSLLNRLGILFILLGIAGISCTRKGDILSSGEYDLRVVNSWITDQNDPFRECVYVARVVIKQENVEIQFSDSLGFDTHLSGIVSGRSLYAKSSNDEFSVEFNGEVVRENLAQGSYIEVSSKHTDVLRGMWTLKKK